MLCGAWRRRPHFVKYTRSWSWYPHSFTPFLEEIRISLRLLHNALDGLIVKFDLFGIYSITMRSENVDVAAPFINCLPVTRQLNPVAWA